MIYMLNFELKIEIIRLKKENWGLSCASRIKNQDGRVLMHDKIDHK